MAEGILPKVDGEIFYGSEATYQAGTCIQVTAGENITSGNVVYIKKSDGKAYVSGTGTADSIRANGIALQTVLSGASIVVQTRGKWITSGLTANDIYYLGVAGAISQTASGVQIGYSLSTTILMIDVVQDDRDAVGMVKSYLKSFTGIPSNNFTAFWVECNGQVLADIESPLNGQTIPNLNASGGGTQRFLRGSTTSGTMGGSETHTHNISYNTNQGSTAGTGQASHPITADNTSTLPSYYEVVWIIKIK